MRVDREGTAHAVTTDGRTFAPSLDPAAKRLVASRGVGTNDDEFGWEATTVVILDLDGTERSQWDLPEEHRLVSSPAWSPTEDKVAVVVSNHAEDQQVVVGGVDGSNLTVVANGARISGPAWSPDGRRLAFTADASDKDGRVLRIADLSTKQVRDLTGNFGQGLRYVDWSNDGHTVLLSWELNDHTGTAVFIDATNGRVVRTAKGDSMVEHPGGRTWIVNGARTEGKPAQHLVTTDHGRRHEVAIRATGEVAGIDVGCR